MLYGINSFGFYGEPTARLLEIRKNLEKRQYGVVGIILFFDI